MRNATRREFLATTSALAAGLLHPSPAPAQDLGERPPKPQGVDVLNPRGRVPVGLIIDDSTCLVNLAHFCIPQFAEVFPDRYTQPWKTLPRAIPDAFVRRFGEWCHEHGVKGKYSVIPYPACVGWLDRDLPGWSKRELRASLDLVRTLMAPDWDLHPELMTHTWAINTKTGRPFEERSERFMENWGWSVGKSADELGDYFGFALRVLKSAGIDCTGITTPGGFGSRSRPALARATLEACRDVCGTEIPHYFRDLYTDERSVAPLVQYASGLGGPEPRCVVSIIGCTGDWFGGWDGLERGDVNKIITEDGRGGRMPQIIARGEPAIMVCHWPGIYFNGEEVGFAIFQEAVRRLEAHYPDSLVWMKPGEVARYWAARELTRIDRGPGRVELDAPFACPGFTIRTAADPGAAPRLEAKGVAVPLREVRRPAQLEPGTWLREGERATFCIDLPKGRSAILA
ncbi:MAG TPA: hypothetical protein VGH33_03370 [Isosphaeraceae bacterium]